MKELMEIWIESFEAFSQATAVLTDAWHTFHCQSPYRTQQEESPFLGVSTKLNGILLTVDEKIRPVVQATFNDKCIKPINSLLTLAQPMNDSLQQRKTLLAEFDSLRMKIEKEARDSHHPNVERKKQKLEESAKKLGGVQTYVYSTFREFELARSHTLGPELAVFISCIYSFSASLHNSLSELIPLVPQCGVTFAHMDSIKVMNLVEHTSQTTLTHQGSQLGLKKNLVRTVEPIFERTAYEGGTIGGYGMISQDPWDTTREPQQQSERSSNYSSVTNSLNLDNLSRPLSEMTSSFRGWDSTTNRTVAGLSSSGYPSQRESFEERPLPNTLLVTDNSNARVSSTSSNITGLESDQNVSTSHPHSTQSKPQKPPRKARPPTGKHSDEDSSVEEHLPVATAIHYADDSSG
jgi:hypothetical protein